MKAFAISILFACAVIAGALPAAASTVASVAKKGTPVGYAKVNADGTIVTFGGRGTASVTASVNAPGYHTVKFMGKYPSDIDVSKVVVQTTAEAASYGVTNDTVTAASPTEIDIDVSDWESDNTIVTGSNVFITIYLGR
ncbi:MAG TPA: hypothetical protein VGK20_13230 [Candidatus Binatia bacterium]|jgi:pectate lyase